MRQSYDVVLASLNNEDKVRLSIRRILKVEVGSTCKIFDTDVRGLDTRGSLVPLSASKCVNPGKREIP